MASKKIQQMRADALAALLIQQNEKAQASLSPLIDKALKAQADMLAAGNRLVLATDNTVRPSTTFLDSLKAILATAKADGIPAYVAVDMTQAALGSYDTLGDVGDDGKVKLTKSGRTVKAYRSSMENFAEAYFADNWDDVLETINSERGEDDAIATDVPELSYREIREAIRLNNTSETRQRIKDLRAKLNAAIANALKAPTRANKDKGIAATEPAKDSDVIAWLSAVIEKAPQRHVVAISEAKPDAASLTAALDEAEEEAEESEGGNSAPVRRSA